MWTTAFGLSTSRRSSANHSSGRRPVPGDDDRQGRAELDRDSFELGPGAEGCHLLSLRFRIRDQGEGGLVDPLRPDGVVADLSARLGDVPGGARGESLPPRAELRCQSGQPLELDVSKRGRDVFQPRGERRDRVVLRDVLVEVFVDELLDGEFAAGKGAQADPLEL
jgi:hypothetical protein